MKTLPTKILTPYGIKMKAKEEKYKHKQKVRWISDLAPSEVVRLKSSLSQAFCGTSYLIECIDTIFEIQGVEKHYPLFEQMQNELVSLNTELYNIAIKSEEDEQNRVEFEKKIDTVLKAMPTLNIKQLDLLVEFVNNLKYKK